MKPLTILDNLQFIIDGLTVTLQVKKRANPAQISASIFHSMCESFSSINLAEDCLNTDSTDGATSAAAEAAAAVEEADSDLQSMAGVKMLAEAIDSIVMRVQVQLTNLTLRLEYVPSDSEPRGMALELKIGSIKYAGEIPGDSEGAPSVDTLVTSTLKKVCIEGIQLFTDEFRFGPASERKISPAASSRRSSVETDDSLDSLLRPPQHSQQSSRLDGSDPLPLACLTGKQELVVRFSETNQFGLPR